MKKYKKPSKKTLIGLLAGVLVVILLGLFVWRFQYLATGTVEVGQKFRMTTGQRVRVAGTDIELTLTEFSMGNGPRTIQKTAQYQWTQNGFNIDRNPKYQEEVLVIHPEGTDSNSYEDITIEKMAKDEADLSRIQP